MSIKDEGYLHDYIAAGLLGFAVGMTVAGALVGYIITYAAFSDWGRVIALCIVSGIFGFIPGGFVAGYLNFRIHKIEASKEMEGLTAGVMALIAHFFITLFVFVTLAAISGPAAGTIMTAWVLIFVWALIFYPIGGFLSGILENRAIPMPTILKFGMRGAPPPPPPPGAQTCPTCGGPLTYIEQYQRWYCYKCKKYV